MRFSKILRELRQEKKLTYDSLAEKIGYSKAIIGFWENEQKQPTMGALIKLADFFDVSIDYLVGREDEFGNRMYKEEFEYNDGTHYIKHKKI